MMFLLDGLHEDMNRILKKPAVEKIESKGRDDDLISAESWRRYLLRNDSELVDMCFGQLKSHVTCTGCGYESVTFDAYSSLSLPIPMKTTVEYDILLYPLPLGTRPLKITLKAPKNCTISEFYTLLSANSTFRKSVENRKHSELGKRKNGNDSSYLLVDSDNLDTEKTENMEVDNHDSDNGVRISSSCSDIETLGNITIETDTDESAVVVNNSPVSKSPSVESYFFHMCTLSTTYENTRVQKTYDDKDIVRDNYSLIVAYEMPHEVPTNNYHYNRYSYTHGVKSTEKSYSYFDLLVGIKKKSQTTSYMNPMYSATHRDHGFNAYGNPIRITYEKGATSREEVNRIIFNAVKLAYDVPDAYSPSRLPYTIHLTTTFANMSKAVVDLNDNKANEPFDISSYDCLICCWNREALPTNGSDSDTSGDDATEQDGVSISAVDIDIPSINILKVKDWLEFGVDSSSARAVVGKKSSAIDIMQCFNKFIEREQMPPEETWYCTSWYGLSSSYCFQKA